ncbi:MAG: hypothetical protein E7311_00050 [Clostridiales bacterium]|nr:hypothetical protein [Clostridiales bacterium]
MKRKSIYFFSIILLLISSIVCIASSVTYYKGEVILLEKGENIEILSNEILIDTTNSNISNEILLKNIGNDKVKTKVNIQLEDNVLSTKIHNLIIKTNENIIQYEKNENGIYSFDIEIPKNEGKKIEINYVTDNDLADAKVIKYSLDNLQLGDKKIGKVKVDIKLNEIDIPLTKAIYPGHYTVDFETNTVTVEYYNFKINNLTKDIILEKDTLKDLLKNSEQLEIVDKNITSNIEYWMKNGIEVDYKNIEYINSSLIYEQLFKPKDYKEKYWNVNTPYNELFNFYLNKQLIKDGKQEYVEDSYYYNEDIRPVYYLYTKELVKKYALDETNSYFTDMYGKNICIAYDVLPLQEELYIYKNHTMEVYNEEYDEYYCDYYVEIENKSQEEILRTKEYTNELYPYSGEKRIFVGIDINGNFIDCTLEEKIEYVNMINADMFIIQRLYNEDLGEANLYTNNLEDGTQIQMKYYNPPYVGYYVEENEEMVRAFYAIHYDIISKEEFLDREWLVEEYITYENYVEQETNEREESYRNSVKRIDDSNLSLAQIPTFILYRGYIYENEGKKFVNFQLPYNSYGTGISTTNQVLETKRAQELIKSNRENNKNIKKEIENEIASIILTQDKVYKNNTEIHENNENNNNLQHYIFLSVITLGIIICIVILIVKGIRSTKNKGGNNNGEEK